MVNMNKVVVKLLQGIAVTQTNLGRLVLYRPTFLVRFPIGVRLQKLMPFIHIWHRMTMIKLMLMETRVHSIY